MNLSAAIPVDHCKCYGADQRADSLGVSCMRIKLQIDVDNGKSS